jgi:hypothetical protein
VPNGLSGVTVARSSPFSVSGSAAISSSRTLGLGPSFPR